MPASTCCGAHRSSTAAGGLPDLRLTVDTTDAGAMVGQVRDGERVHPVACEPVAVGRADALARSLAPVVDVGSPEADDSDLPGRSPTRCWPARRRWIPPSQVVDRWRENNSLIVRDGSPPVRRKKEGNLRALVGHAGSAPFFLDLRRDGPHALVGGTTGAGKSEFLQSWVLGMAAAHSPDRLTFLFVDYKGGAAFADCVKLPHTVGLVTDLSPHLVRRALTSLRAELRHREHLLQRKKAKDLISLEKTGDPDCPPSLVIVVDEFAALVQEVPEFVDGVVDVAQRGRSLGLHLILATQRPAGVIKDNLRANTNLRIALRMADTDDSVDILGDPMAAHFDPSIPGRGAAEDRPGPDAAFQTGYAGGWTTDAPPRPRIDVAELAFGGGATWEVPEVEAVEVADPGPTDIARMVATISAAAGQAGVPVPRKPWLPELAPIYNLKRCCRTRAPTSGCCWACWTTRLRRRSRPSPTSPTGTATWPSSAPAARASRPRCAPSRRPRPSPRGAARSMSTGSTSAPAACGCWRICPMSVR